MPITLTIQADDENDFRRQLMRIAVPYLEGFSETGGFDDPEPETPEPPSIAGAGAEGEPAQPETVAGPKKVGRPRGSTNKPKGDGDGAKPNAADAPLSLAEQIQIITDAAHDQPDKFKPLLVPLRDKLGVQYISKASEIDRPALQEFINAHGLAV